MDKLLLASVVAREPTHEITDELVTRHMLKEAESDAPSGSKQIELQLAPALILISLLALFLVV